MCVTLGQLEWTCSLILVSGLHPASRYTVMRMRDSQSWGMPLDCLQMVSDIVDRAVKRHRWSAARIGMVKRLLHVSVAVYKVK